MLQRHPTSPSMLFRKTYMKQLHQTLRPTEGREFSFAKSCLDLRESLKGGFTYSPMLMLRIAGDTNEEGIHTNTDELKKLLLCWNFITPSFT